MRILIKGAGDLATGIACRLHRCGYELLMTDIEVPTAVRRTVSFSRAIYEGSAVVEEIEAVYCGRIESAAPDGTASDLRDNEHSPATICEKAGKCISAGKIAVVADPEAAVAKYFKPDVIIDAIIAKKNLGTAINDAPLVIGVGPGFTAGVDCHCVIETKRGHYLGKLICNGSAIPNTGVPGDIGGYTTERIIRATADGRFVPLKNIADRVEAGEAVAKVICETADDPAAIEETGKLQENERYEKTVYANITGIIRGLLQEGVQVFSGMKCGDIDPRCEREHCFTVSDKARAIGGGALEAVSRFERRRNNTGIVLLAAGESRRYGSNKLLEPINGKRMFEYAVDAAYSAITGKTDNSSCEEDLTGSTVALDCSDDTLTADCPVADGYTACSLSSCGTSLRRLQADIVIVTGYDEIARYAAEKGIAAVENKRPELGISESLKLGLKYMSGKDSVLFAVCDQPGLTEDSFVRLIDAYAASDKSLACMGRHCPKEGVSPEVFKASLGNPCLFNKKYFPELMELSGDTGGKRVIARHADDLTVVYAAESELSDIDRPDDRA